MAGTSYISTATAQTNGAGFSLAAGDTRQFYAVPTLGVGEALSVQVSNDDGTTWIDVGDVVTSSKRVGTVTSQGTAASYFRVNKSETATTTVVYYD